MLATIPIVLLEPAELLREGIARALAGTRYDVIACSGELDSIMLRDEGSWPTLALIGCNRTQLAGVCASVADRFPGCRIAVMLDQIGCEEFEGMLHCGADGCLPRTVSCEGLVKSLDLILEGVFVMPFRPHPWRRFPEQRRDATDVVDRSPGTASLVATPIPSLSERERLVLQGLAEGVSNKIIARRLGITESTVKVHVKSIFRKTKMSNRVQLALWAANCVESARMPDIAAAVNGLAIVGPDVGGIMVQGNSIASA